MSSPVLYFDLASPYAYLAVARAETVFGAPVELEPILLGAMFKWRGWGSWAHTPERQARVADIEERAQRYGLPQLAWPADWPANSLAAMRGATLAKRDGDLGAYARAVYRAEFAEGADITDTALLARCAAEAGLDPASFAEEITRQEIKDALRAATEAAWAAGVSGVPSVRIAERVHFGDDQLEAAAASLTA